MDNHVKMKRIRRLSGILFVVYMLGVAYFMFLADSFHRTAVADLYRYNLELFLEIDRFSKVWAVHGPLVAIVNLFGNVVVFMPFGFFLPFHVRKLRNGLVVACLTFLFSLLIETTQLIFRIGVFDVDDLLLNTIGGILGYAVFRIGFHLYRRRKKKLRKTGDYNAEETGTL